MICISHKLSELLQKSCTRAFNFPTMHAKVTMAGMDSEYDYISSISKDLFEKHREEMSRYWRSDQLFATNIAQEITTQMESNPYIAKTNLDSLGQLNYTISNQNYIQAIQTIVKSKSLQVEYSQNQSTKHGILFPFSQIAEKPLLNTFRGANFSESMARLQATLQGDITRYAVIQNNQPFHGIIYEYLKQTQNKNNGQIEDAAINFENLAQFIISQNLFTQEDVAEFGTKAIIKIQQGESNSKDILEKLTNAAIGNFQEVYSKFTPLNIKFIRGDQIEGNTFKYLDGLNKKGVMRNSQSNKLLTHSKNQNIAFIDPVGSLTREGFLLGLLKNIHVDDFINEFHVSSDIHDDLLYKNISSVLKECSIDAKLHYYGHNNLFSQQADNPNQSINTLSDLFTQMKQMNITKYKQMYPDIMPNLIEAQGELFLDQCLGWTRYLDHRKARNVPYLMSSENVIDFIHKNNEKLTNARQNLLEMLDSYNVRKEGIAPISDYFTFQNSQERALAKVLVYFSDALHSSLQTNEFKPLIEYSELLLGTIDFMQKENVFKKYDANDKLTEKDIANKVVLLDATNKIIHKLFYILGVLNA